MKRPVIRLDVKMPNGERLFNQAFTEEEAAMWLLNAVALATAMNGNALRAVEVTMVDYRPEDER